MMGDMMNYTDSEQFHIPENWTELNKEMYRTILTDGQVQNLMQSDIKFDLMITEVFGMDPMIGFANYFKMPVVLISTLRTNPFVSTWTGTPSPPSFIPFVMSHLPKEMNFLQRVKNTLFQTFFEVLWGYMQYATDRVVYNEIFPDPKPSFYQARKDAVSLVLMNSHISLDGAQPLMTNIIEVGGMQVTTKSEPLPQELQQFMDNSRDGIVYFSFGTNVQASIMHEKQRNAFIKVLTEIKENVIIKWDHPQSIAHVPKRKFYTSDWLPQSDILAHPKVKIFVTHGGLMSTTETIYRGVPTVGIPVFGDQQANIKYHESLGIGVRLSYSNVTEESFRWALTEVLSNTRYQNTVKDISNKFKDRLVPPLETAKWWIEYVIRHKGAPFLRSPAIKLNCFQYHNLDVYGFIFGIMFITFWVVKILIRQVYLKMCKSSNQKIKTS